MRSLPRGTITGSGFGSNWRVDVTFKPRLLDCHGVKLILEVANFPFGLIGALLPLATTGIVLVACLAEVRHLIDKRLDLGFEFFDGGFVLGHVRLRSICSEKIGPGGRSVLAV
mgnify:CR=1 FL=1